MFHAESLLDTAQPLVLVVDDESSICRTLSGVLEDESFATISAHSGPEALEKVLQFDPDLVFLDIWMPGWDGIETLERIKAASPDTEVIVISGHATIANALEATKRGAFDFIEKPLDIESIIFAATRAWERRKKCKSESSAALQPAATTSSRSQADSVPLLTHAGVLSTGLKGKNLGQRTLKGSALLYGHCLHSGRKSGLVLEPLPQNSGIHFAKIGDTRAAPAFVDFVQSTELATTIRSGSTAASTIEHLLSALHAYRITNLLVKCNGEVPILDGSAIEFCKTIEQVGIEEQGGEWFDIVVDQPLRFRPERAKTEAEQILLEPADSFCLSYELNYPAPVGHQKYEYTYTGPESFKNEIAPARTFGFMKDIERLQKAGLAAGGRWDNFILIGNDRILNTELRFPEELVRHKILDAIGDLFLLGRPLRCRVRAAMTGHSDNIEVLRALKSKIH